MKTIDIYIIKKKITYLLSTTITVFAFIFVISLFENINMMTKKNIPIDEILKNVALTSPFYTYLLTPIISMISSILLLNYFKSTSQYKAVYASGYNPLVFLKNILIILIPFSILLLLITDNFVSNIYSITKNKIKYSNTINFKTDSIILQSKLKENLLLEDTYIYDEKRNNHIYVSKVYWDDEQKKWYGENVSEISFFQGKVEINKYEIKEINTLPPPREFIIEEIIDPNSYSIRRLIERVKKLRKISLNTNQELTLIFFRITIISMNITAAFIAFLIFKTKLINNKGTAITISIIASLVMWFILTVLKRSSDIEIIQPYNILILQNLIIYSIIFYIFRKIKSYF